MVYLNVLAWVHSPGQKAPELWLSGSWITTWLGCSVLASFVTVFPKHFHPSSRSEEDTGLDRPVILPATAAFMLL